MTLPRFRCLLGFLLVFWLAAPPAHAVAPAPLGGGSQLEVGGAYRCTAGFAATGGSTGYLIAGMACGRPGDTVRSAGRVVGVVSGAPSPPTGAIVIRVTNTTDWRLVGSIPPVNGRPVTGSAEAPVGASVCKYGATSGWRCGVIQGKNQTITFPEGTLRGLTRTNVCVEPGDNGAPFVSGSQAQGVLVGGSGNCASGGTSYFLPVNRVLSVYGLTILTGP
ncbi:S1 family peptidase [Kibdelosporangium phytohabitans]|uniref:Peptidase S1 n=1 Tax=Kibdelosporangium phytohabitans TaxID=860235 RepID=A0A0N9I3H1_9PSEU|nr:S1 family peptidase [Kibdelosporangium phytohabitans]ALG10601.1 peptidase S1 [Kibdelosporangium phytohabitans]MBE1461713.1 streptogrisin C [Kibdelosporangium phytohabitans]